MATSQVSTAPSQISFGRTEAQYGRQGINEEYEDLERSIALHKAFRVETAPKLRFDRQSMWRISAWSRHANTQVDWVSVRSRELSDALQSLFDNPLRTDVNRMQRELSEDARQKDIVLGAHLSATASDEVMDRLDQESNRRIDGAPSSLKIYQMVDVTY